METNDDLMVAVIELPEIVASAPRLLAWGAMLQIPQRATIKLVVEIADLLPPTVHTVPLTDFEIDVIKDAIGYIYDMYCPVEPPSDTAEIDDAVIIHEFETTVVEAAKRVRQLLGDIIVECHFIDVRQSRYIVIEVSYDT